LTEGVDFKFDRLPLFCHFCGKLGHTEKDNKSMQKVEDEQVTFQYGDWLVASPRKKSTQVVLKE